MLPSGVAPLELPDEPPLELPDELPLELPDELPLELPDELPLELPDELPLELPDEPPLELPDELPLEELLSSAVLSAPESEGLPPPPELLPQPVPRETRATLARDAQTRRLLYMGRGSYMTFVARSRGSDRSAILSRPWKAC
jgi:hypothetical protein